MPQAVRDELAARAARSGRSLQEYMLAELSRLAARPSVEDWVAEVRDQKRGSHTVLEPGAILADLSEERR